MFDFRIPLASALIEGSATMNAVLEDDKSLLNPLGLTPVDKAKELLTRRRNLRRIVQVDDPSHLNLQWDNESHGGKGGFVIKPPANFIQTKGPVKDWFNEHGKMELTATAVDTILHHADLSLPKAIQPKLLPLAFVESIRSKMDKMKGLNLITTGTATGDRKVEAFVPGKMNPISDQELVDNVLGVLSEKYGDQIQGVRVNSFGGGSTKRYSVIFGKAVLKEGNDLLKTTWPAIDVMSDDIGLGPTSITLGLYRLVCVNLATANFWNAGCATWNRIGNSEGFMKRMNSVIDVAGRFAVHSAKALDQAHKERIESPEEIIDALGEHKIFSRTHLDEALDLVSRDDPQTGFDMFQVMTDSAKCLSAVAQQKAQGSSLAILLGGGFTHVALHGLDEDVARENMSKCLGGE